MNDRPPVPVRHVLLACAAGAAAVAAWYFSWRVLGLPYSAKDMASSSVGIALAATALALYYFERDRRERGKDAPEAGSASGLGRVLQYLEPIDYDRPGFGFPRMSGAALRARLVLAVFMVSCIALPLLAAGVWASRFDVALGGAVLAAIFSYFGACDAYTLRRRRRPGPGAR